LFFLAIRRGRAGQNYENTMIFYEIACFSQRFASAQKANFWKYFFGERANKIAKRFYFTVIVNRLIFWKSLSDS